jgi:hypothetical protein
MASDSDDLEQQLRQNLKLRRELGAKVVKAKQGGRMAYRLGWVLYWACLALAVVWALVWAFALGGAWRSNEFFNSLSYPQTLWNFRRCYAFGDCVFYWAFLWVPVALILYGLGRAFRYVLSGE